MPRFKTPSAAPEPTPEAGAKRNVAYEEKVAEYEEKIALIAARLWRYRGPRRPRTRPFGDVPADLPAKPRRLHPVRGIFLCGLAAQPSLGYPPFPATFGRVSKLLRV